MSNERSIEELRKYRETLSQDVLDGEKEYHTTITYIASGALGLFLTINEAIFNINKAEQLWIFIVSIIFLFATLVLYIFSIIIDIRANEDLREKSDEMIKKKRYDQDTLDEVWKIAVAKSKKMFYLRFGFLIIGITAEIVFIVLNIYLKK